MPFTNCSHSTSKLLKMWCFVLFVLLHYLTVGTVLVYKEKKLKDRYKNDEKTRAKAMDRAVGVANFSNATIATILSSIALYNLTYGQKTNIYLSQPSSIAQWTIESVCGYIFVELTFIFANSFRLSERYWRLIKNSLMGSMVFHVVALLGLSSVLVFDTGYSIALWVVWSELTTVFLGIENYMEEKMLEYEYPTVYQLLEHLTSVCFVLQRVVLFVFLLVLCGQQFTWQPLFIAQLLILCTGTIMNVRFSIERIFT